MSYFLEDAKFIFILSSLYYFLGFVPIGHFWHLSAFSPRNFRGSHSSVNEKFRTRLNSIHQLTYELSLNPFRHKRKSVKLLVILATFQKKLWRIKEVQNIGSWFHIIIWFLTIKINETVRSGKACIANTWCVVTIAVAIATARWLINTFEIWTLPILQIFIPMAIFSLCKNF